MRSILCCLLLFSLASLAYADYPATVKDAEIDTQQSEIKQLERELQERKNLLKTHKRYLRVKAIELKKLELQKKRSLRCKRKCETVTQQIDRLKQRQRTGYTIQQGLTIERKLAEYQTEKRKYCKHE